jgi:hypothetical protein
MKKILGVTTAVLLVLGFGTSRLLAQAPFNEDMSFSLGGTTTATTFDDAGNDLVLGAGIAGAAGVQSFNLGTVLSSGSGLGSITLTYDPGTAGTYFFDVATQEVAGAPAFNEYAASHGTLGSGESYEIGYLPVDPVTGQVTGANPQVYNDVANASGLGTLGNTNSIGLSPNSNFSENCLTEPGCNGYAAVDLGLSFVLTSSEEEIVTFNTSTTAPGSGFYIEQTNPDDQDNGGDATNLYYTISGTEQSAGAPPPPPPPGPTPEPSSWILMLTGMGGVITKVRSKFAA